ncbi:MAG: hypothetical protein ABFS37_03340 [Acidobacteriota bacterium]
MRKDVVLSVMWAELRLTRRLVRYWIFLSLALLSGMLIYIYYSGLHAFFSSFSATAAIIGPRFLIGAMGLYYVAFFLFGLVFMAFDVRARDVRERMVEVLDARPMTTPELMVGRFTAQLLAAWVPAWLMVALMQLLGSALPALGSPIGEPLQPTSLVMFTVFMCLPAMAFGLALTYLVTLLVRSRLIAAVVTVGVLVGVIWASFKVSPIASVFLDVSGMYSVVFPSDILPAMVDLVGFLQRLGYLVAAFGLLALAVAVHPRLDGGSRRLRAALGAGLMAVAVVLLGAGGVLRASNLRQLDSWLAAHEARASEQRPDIIRIEAATDIDPGKTISVEAEISIAAPGEAALAQVLLTLNPGLELHEVTTDGSDIGFEHSNGLLELDLRLAPGTRRRVKLRYSGKPDIRFGYLDSVRTPERLSAMDSQLYILGYDRGLNDRRYVALMPAIAWLPLAGAAVESKAGTDQGPDFFDIDLQVTVPEGWLAAGPGARHDQGTTDGRSTFHLNPGAPVDGAAVIASVFESFALDIEGLRLEMLLTPGHLRTVENLSDARDAIRERVADRLQEFAEAGLAYPYDGFTLVEAPNALRGFGGGWRLGSVLSQPGMMVVRELGFPLARFDVPFRDESDWQDHEGGLPQARLERLEEFFINDFSGGNLFSGATRSFFLTQCSARGPGREALNWTLDELGTLLAADARGYFSAHLFSAEMQGKIGQAIQGHLIGGGRGHFADSVIEVFASRPAVWKAVLDGAPVDIDPWDDPQKTIDGLSLKAGTLAQVIYDDLGFEGSVALLASLRRDFSGTTFTLDDVVAAAEQQAPGLGRIIEDMLTTTRLPGLVGQQADSYRLPDGADGGARYQLNLIVRNDEPTPGLFRVVYYVGADDDQERQESDPLRIDGQGAIRFSTVLTRPPTGVWVNPYLSLNRSSFRVPLPEVDETVIIEAEPSEGVTMVEFEVADTDAVIVDDLDEGFEVVEGGGRSGLRLGARGQDDAELDNGLPVEEFGPLPRAWSRATSATAHGRYRHTLAWMRKGKGESRAQFTGEVLKPGPWELEIHLPHKQRFRVARNWGVWKLAVVQGDDRHEIDFDAKEAPRGWNLVDSFDLDDGEVIVEFSDETTGMIVVADAVRWTPVRRTGGEVAQ